MGQYVLKNKLMPYARGRKGFSLIEVMIALVVFLLVFLGIMQAALLSIDQNMHNILRDEAITIASARMEETRSMPFDNVVNDTATNPINLPACGNPPVNDAGPYPVGITRDFRNIHDFPFGTSRTVNDPNADTKQIQILVRWAYKNECYTHSATTLRRR